MLVSKRVAKKVADELQINLEKYSLDLWKVALEIELEHGLHNKKTNITDNDYIKTGKIALAHILEYPNYYEKLISMEEKLKKYWEGKKKPHILKE
jgi:hypothetical protein